MMIQCWKMLNDIQAQNIGVMTGELLQPIDSFMRTFTQPIGIAVRDKPSLKKRLNHIAQCVVNHPVPKGRSTDKSPFGFTNGEMRISARLVTAIPQGVLQLK